MTPLLKTATADELRGTLQLLVRGIFGVRPERVDMCLLDYRLEENMRKQGELLTQLNALAGQGQHKRYSQVSRALDGLYKQHTALMDQRYPKR